MVGSNEQGQHGAPVLEARLLPRIWTVLLSDPGPYTILADGLPADGATLTEAGPGLWRLSLELSEPEAPVALSLIAADAARPLATQVVGRPVPAEGDPSSDLAAEVAALRAELAVMRAALRALARERSAG